MQERRAFLRAKSAGARPSEAQLAEAEKTLFAEHTGAAGINFAQYSKIKVERTGCAARCPPPRGRRGCRSPAFRPAAHGARRGA